MPPNTIRLFGSSFFIFFANLSAHPNWEENKAEIPIISGLNFFSLLITISSSKPN